MINLIKKTISFLKKAVVIFAVYLTVINLFFYFISKNIPQQPVDPIKTTREQIYQTINDPQLNRTKQGKTAIGFYRATLCALIGEGCTDNPADGDKNFERSVFGKVTKLIVFPYTNPPASGIYWAYSGLQQAHLIPQAYAAQGVGFSALKPFINLWEIFRDIAYLLLVIVLIAIGFMIMFRMKINPQTVIAVENALPKIVISLLLITFSFAIAGFLIDLMYIITAIGISILSQNTIINFDAQKYQNEIFSGAGKFLFGQVFWNGDYWGVGPALFGLLPGMLSFLVRVSVVAVAYAYFLKPPIIDKIFNGEVVEGVAETGGIPEWLLKSIFALILLPFISLLAPTLLSVLVFLTALLIFFRIFFTLFKAYLEVLLLVIFSPIILIFEAIPGKSSFSFWFKTLLGDLLVFPVVAILIIISTIIVAVPSQSGYLWQPPFINNVSPNAFSVLVGVGIMFLIPDLIKLIKELLGVKGIPVGLGPGLFLAGVGTGTGGLMKMTGTYASLTQAFPGLQKKAQAAAKNIPLLNTLLGSPQGAQTTGTGKSGDQS